MIEDKMYRPDINGPKIPATPDSPEKRDDVGSSKRMYRKTKPATPDLILFKDDAVPVELMTQLLFENIGGMELINISRNDIINGQNISYSLLSNTSAIEQLYSSKKFVKLSGSTEEIFKNFGIRFAPKVPTEGTSPLLCYVGELNSVVGCVGYPIINRYTDELVGCATGYLDAQNLAEELSPPRNVVYSDPLTGDIVVDVTNMLTDERVDIEILETGEIEDDTIY